MNTTETTGNSNRQKGMLKQKFGALTENYQMFTEGKKDEIRGKIQINLARTKAELNKIVAKLFPKNCD